MGLLFRIVGVNRLIKRKMICLNNAVMHFHDITPLLGSPEIFEDEPEIISFFMN